MSYAQQEEIPEASVQHQEYNVKKSNKTETNCSFATNTISNLPNVNTHKNQRVKAILNKSTVNYDLKMQENDIDSSSEDELEQKTFNKKNIEIFRKISSSISKKKFIRKKLLVDSIVENKSIQDQNQQEDTYSNTIEKEKSEKGNLCETCKNVLQEEPIKCELCDKQYHKSCLLKEEKKIESEEVFICDDCSTCPECKKQICDEIEKCTICSHQIHRRCAYSAFCKSCREIIYLKSNPPILDLFENSEFSNFIKNNGFLRDMKEVGNPCTELIVNKLYIDTKTLNPQFLSPFEDLSVKKFVCQMCFFYYNEKVSYERHKIKCDNKFRGNIVYEKGKHKIFEVDGEFDTLMCRNLCLVAKCFLDHKTLYYDVEPFLFYLLYENDHFIGYFSREKYSKKFNLSCIVVLPCYQGKGYGYFLIDFSYRLFQTFKRKGTPEKPLSDQGLAVYKKYWKYKVYQYLQGRKNEISVKEIANSLGMTSSDIIFALELLEFIKKGDDDRFSILVTDKLIVEMLVCDPNYIVFSNIRIFKE